MRRAVLAILVAASIISCKKSDDDNQGVSTMKVYITDAPGDYEHIYLDVQEIAINNGGWQTLTLTQPDTFDILDYTNGDKLLLADGQIDAGSTSEIRLVLGTNNTIVLKDGTSHELKVPSGSSSGLKIKLNNTKTTQPGQTYYVVLDFDAAKSVVVTGNGKYSLKPVIRGYWEGGMGAAEGYAIPDTSQIFVHAINGNDTLGSTITDNTGYYKVTGLPQAVYTFSYQGNGKDATVSGIQVLQNQTAVIDTVDLY